MDYMIIGAVVACAIAVVALRVRVTQKRTKPTKTGNMVDSFIRLAQAGKPMIGVERKKDSQGITRTRLHFFIGNTSQPTSIDGQTLGLIQTCIELVEFNITNARHRQAAERAYLRVTTSVKQCCADAQQAKLPDGYSPTHLYMPQVQIPPELQEQKDYFDNLFAEYPAARARAYLGADHVRHGTDAFTAQVKKPFRTSSSFSFPITKDE